MRVRRHLPLLLLVAIVAAPSALPAAANTSHAGWPRINGMLLMNKLDQSRPLDARPGHNRFASTGDPVSRHARHNELLGGHGNDRIHAGPWGDVIWGDYKPSGQPETQVDHLYGGPGKDFIYASHGTNVIRTGGGRDVIHAHFGRGTITCGSGHPIVYISHRSRPHYRLRGCHRISYKTAGH